MALLFGAQCNIGCNHVWMYRIDNIFQVYLRSALKLESIFKFDLLLKVDQTSLSRQTGFE